jgi:hypothetical protein
MIKHGISILRYYTLLLNISKELLNLYNTIKMFLCMQAHPDAHVFRKKVAPCYNDLCIIYGHAVADGRYSLSCFDDGFEYEGKNK